MKRTWLWGSALLLAVACPRSRPTRSFSAPRSRSPGRRRRKGSTRGTDISSRSTRSTRWGAFKVGGKTYTVALKYYDDETKPERTAQLIEKLINEDKVNLLLGPYGSSPTGTAAPIAERYKIPMVEANGAAESVFSKGYKYSFMILSPAKLYLRGIIDAVRSKDPTVKTVAILGENESFSKEVAQGAAEYAKEKGMEVVYDELYPSNAQDVSALLTAIKGKNPQVILGSGHLQDSLLIVKQAQRPERLAQGDGILGRTRPRRSFERTWARAPTTSSARRSGRRRSATTATIRGRRRRRSATRSARSTRTTSRFPTRSPSRPSP